MKKSFLHVYIVHAFDSWSFLYGNKKNKSIIYLSVWVGQKLENVVCLSLADFFLEARFTW